MEAVKAQVKKMYVILGIMFIIGAIIFFILQKQAILSFTFGTLVSAINLYFAYLTFKQLYTKEQATKIGGILAGPFPKLLLIIFGSILCYNFPQILPIIPFLIGVCLYAFTYLLFGLTDFLKFDSKKQ